jgi:hypothetical protein
MLKTGRANVTVAHPVVVGKQVPTISTVCTDIIVATITDRVTGKIPFAGITINPLTAIGALRE